MLYRLFLMATLMAGVSSMSLADNGSGSRSGKTIRINDPFDQKEVSNVIRKNLGRFSKDLQKSEGVFVRLDVDKNGDVVKVEVLKATDPDLVKEIVEVVSRLKFRYSIYNEKTENAMSYHLMFKLHKA